MKKISKIKQLRHLGFDLSYAIPFEKAWKVRCSQCEALCINGVPCHETGCSNDKERREIHEEDL